MNFKTQKVIEEAVELETECLIRAREHNFSARAWAFFAYSLGYASAALSAIAAGVAVSTIASASAIAGTISLVVTGLVSISTFVNPKDKSDDHQTALDAFENLASDARHLSTEAALAQDPHALNDQLVELIDRKKETQKQSPHVYGWLQNRSNPVQRKLDRILSNSDQGTRVHQFPDVAELYRFIAARIRTAQTSIDDITWGSRTGYRSKDEESAYKEYLKALNEVCKGEKVNYREISSLANAHYFQRASDLTKYHNYQLSYYDTRSVPLPLLSYIVIDKREVLLGFYRVPVLEVDGEQYLSIEDPHVVGLFNDYFTVLWAKAEKLKSGSNVRNTRLEEIEAALPTEAVASLGSNPN